MQIIDWNGLLTLLMDAQEHYQKTAPQVTAYLEDLEIRLKESQESVNVLELVQVGTLREDGVWMDPNFAANRMYHVQIRSGREVLGGVSF